MPEGPLIRVENCSLFFYNLSVAVNFPSLAVNRSPEVPSTETAFVAIVWFELWSECRTLGDRLVTNINTLLADDQNRFSVRRTELLLAPMPWDEDSS